MARRVKPKLYVAITQPGTPLMEDGGSVVLNRLMVRYPGYGGMHIPGELNAWPKSDEYDDAIFPYVSLYRNAGDPWPMTGAEPIYSNGVVVGHAVPAFLKLPLGGKNPPIMLYPFLDTRGYETAEEWGVGTKTLSQFIDLNYWDSVGYGTTDGRNNFWHDRPFGEVGAARLYYQGAGELPPAGEYVGLRSRFELPCAPVFAIDLWRARMQDDIPPQPYGTYIKFGEGPHGYHMLELPHEGPARMWWKDDAWTGSSVLELRTANERGASISVATLTGAMDQAEANEDPAPTRLWFVCTQHGVLVSNGNDPGRSGTLFRYPDRYLRTDWVNQVGIYPFVRKGKVVVFNNAGQFAFIFWPITMPSYASYRLPIIYLPYPWDADTFDAGIRVMQNPVYDLDEDETWVLRSWAKGTWIRGLLGLSRVPAGAHMTEYMVTVYAYASTDVFTAGPQISNKQMNPLGEDTPLSLRMSRSPIVYWNDYFQDSSFYEFSQNAPYVDAKRIAVQASKGRIGRGGRVSVDNQTGGWGSTARAGRVHRVSVEGTWVLDDGTEETSVCILDGFTTSFDTAEHQDIDMDASVVSIIEQLGNVSVEGDAPVFDGRRIEDVFYWICEKFGVYCQCEVLEPANGNGGIQYFNFGLPSEPVWRFEDGRSWVDILKNIAIYAGNAGLFVRGGVLYKGCPYCVDSSLVPTRRNAVSGIGLDGHMRHWWDHISNGPNSPGCLHEDILRTGNAAGVDFVFTMSAADAGRVVGITGDHVMMHEIEDIRAPIMEIEGSYYNSVIVKGARQADMDEPITYNYTDWASIQAVAPYVGRGYPIGRKQQNTWSFSWANTHAIVNRLAKAYYSRYSYRPEYCRVRVPFLQNAVRGQVFAVIGGEELDIDLNAYRIVEVQHDVGGRSGPRGTELVGWFIHKVVLAEIGGNGNGNGEE